MKPTKLIDNEMRVKIAERSGWKCVNQVLYNPRGEIEAIAIGAHTLLDWRDCLPDYLSDLNAMHEAEAYFDSVPVEEYKERGWGRYHQCLIGITKNLHVDGQFIVRATARQRAEAFLAATERREVK